MLQQIIFGYLSVAIVITALLIVTRRNPVHSILWMLVLFIHIAVLYLTLNAEFLAAIQIIVYAGAILVLFLFVVLLLNLKEETKTERYVDFWQLGVTAALALFIIIFLSLRAIVPGPSGRYTIDLIEKEGNVSVLGSVLYTEYLFPFEVVSVILLVAIIGAIALAKKKLKT